MSDLFQVTANFGSIEPLWRLQCKLNLRNSGSVYVHNATDDINKIHNMEEMLFKDHFY